MYCENELCIYWKDNKCICASIWLDELGLCRTGIHVTIEHDMIEKQRTIQLARLEQADLNK